MPGRALAFISYHPVVHVHIGPLSISPHGVGIAVGFLLAALHHVGLATLTHTPSPMKFLNKILGRPADLERPFLLLVVGYPAPDARVPDISRKPLTEIATFV
jgi:hypothetical protein